MSYKLKLEQIKTLSELYDFRDELKSTIDKESILWHQNPSHNDENIININQARFFMERVEAQIKHFERKGLILTSIVEVENEVKERVFTEKEIMSLQNEVYIITGNGEVMQLFNKLLGVAVGSGS